jgi:hypothetical protein
MFAGAMTVSQHTVEFTALPAESAAEISYFSKALNRGKRAA